MDMYMLQQLYEKYGREVQLYIYSLCRDWNLSEDLLQETFVKALLSLSEQHTNMRAWLYRVARNLCLNAVRKEKRSMPQEEDRMQQRREMLSDVEDSMLENLIRQEEYRILYHAIAKLAAVKREVLQMQYFGGMPLKEIAGILQVTPDYVRVISHRAKRELRKYLEEEGMTDHK